MRMQMDAKCHIYDHSLPTHTYRPYQPGESATIAAIYHVFIKSLICPGLFFLVLIFWVQFNIGFWDKAVKDGWIIVCYI